MTRERIPVSGVKFPASGIAVRSDVTQYIVQDLRDVFTELLERATPQEKQALAELLSRYADEARKAV